MADKLRLIVDTGKNIDINKTAVKLNKKSPLFSSGVSTFVILEDAKKYQEKIFEIPKIGITSSNIHKFIYLKK